MDKNSRLRLFYERLHSAPPAQSHWEAFSLISTTLNQIEDEHSGVANNPSHWLTDGRLYPPQADSIRTADGFPNVMRYRSLSHNIFIAINGAIEVRAVGSDEVVFEKPGADGKGVWSEQN